jgi:flagellar hook assembly protein FlgD
MKRSLILGIILMLCASVAFGAAFSPTLTKMDAPKTVKYDFDGKNLTIPVTVSGTPILSIFLVFTKDKASTINKIQNGYLGWHYVNKIDTCLYVSPSMNMTKGANNVVWDGKDEGGTMVPAGEYTYYIWGYDNVSARQQAVYAITYGSNQYYVFQYNDKDGKALGQPILRGVVNKWVMGTDPMDSLLVETTKLSYPSGWSGVGYGPSSLDPEDFNMFFISVANKNSVLQGISKYQWVPNGNAVQQTSWGDNGFVTYAALLDAEPGVVTDGAYLYSGDSNHHAIEAKSSMYVFDFDGSIVKQIDLTDWWSDPNDMSAGGQMNGGPTTYHEKDGYIFLSCHCSCIKQMVKPMAEDEEDFVVWTNQNGDYTLDHNYDPTSPRKWICNDFNVGPYTYNIYADANLFSLCPSFDMGAVSFGLMAPDGTGMGYFAWAGETAQQKYGNTICDGNTPYDGIYTTMNQADVAGISKGIWYIGHDSVKGTIGSQIGVKDSGPAAFSVAQNSPNPFNPSTTISFTLAKAGKTTVEVFNAAGQKVDTILNANLSAGSHSVTWNAVSRSAGVYFYTVKNGSFTKTMKMTLLK